MCSETTQQLEKHLSKQQKLLRTQELLRKLPPFILTANISLLLLMKLHRRKHGKTRLKRVLASKSSSLCKACLVSLPHQAILLDSKE